MSARTVLACAGLVAVTAVAVLLVVGTGSADLDPARTLAALAGHGAADDVLIVRGWRLPRAVAGVVLGAALAVSGGLLQSLTRNPLGSPDVIGFDTGAYTGALVATIVFGGTFAVVTTSALVGGLATALAVVLLARTGGGGTSRMIIFGIAVSALLASVNTYLVLAADVRTAMSASSWALGSLNDVGWARLLPAAAVLAVCGAAVVPAVRPVRVLALGDRLAHGLGLDPARARLLLTAPAVVLSATAVAVTGPIAFVALAAPHLAALLTGNRGFAPVPTALAGAALLTGSDLVAMRIVPGSPLPVGAVTISLGGAYLVALVAVRARAARARPGGTSR